MSDTDDIDEFQDFLDYTRRVEKLKPRRYLRDFDDPFRKHSTSEFFAMYRFTPQVVKNAIIPMVKPDLLKTTARGLPFSPEIMILITLRYYATGSFQRFDGKLMDVCQQSASRIVTKVSTLLASKMRGVVNFPSTSDGISLIKQKFYEIAEFPGVIGCLDCTHIKIRRPGGSSAEIFRNGDGFFSINVQIVVGPDLRFHNLVARWPGRVQDSIIYNNSTLKQSLESGHLRGMLLGDSSYEVSPVLMTPFLTPMNPAQERYNNSHIKTWNVVEQAIELWKRRFPCLQVGMAVKLETVRAIICACAALHNIAIVAKDDLDPLLGWEEDENEEIPDNVSDNADCGFAVRDGLVERFFK